MPNNVQYEELYNFLLEVDDYFTPRLSEKVNLSDWAKKLLDKGTICAVSENGEIKSLVAGYTDNLVDGMAYIALVATKKTFRGAHLARVNMNSFISICRRKNIKRIHLYTNTGNERAVTLYKSLGFERYRTDNEPRPSDIHLLMHLE